MHWFTVMTKLLPTYTLHALHQKLKKALPGFLLTSTDFRPQFEMKLSYRRVVEALSRGQEAAR